MYVNLLRLQISIRHYEESKLIEEDEVPRSENPRGPDGIISRLYSTAYQKKGAGYIPAPFLK